MLPSTSGRPIRARRAFTIIELLVVISIIGILAAILIPTISGAYRGSLRAKTRVQFNQWATAIEGFRQEYGYYPNFTRFPDGKIDTFLMTEQFIQTLTGKKLDGTALATGDPGLLAGNTKRISFCSFGTNDLTSANLLQDAFGNTTIVVLMDTSYDGLVKIGTPGDYTVSPPVIGTAGPLLDTQFVRAGVIFYSAGAGDQVVKSWE